MELQVLPSRIGQVRRIVSAQLRYWHLDSLTDQAILGVTELLSNVHRHARPDKTCTVEIELELDRLTVSVRDHDPRLPEMGDAQPLATCGRGLAMVAALSESWGVRQEGDTGKVVWFTLPTAALAPAPAAAGAGCSPVYAGEGTSPVLVGGEAGELTWEPGPEAVLEPEPEPILEPEPEPVLEPEAEPVLGPASAPVREPDLEPVLESALAPDLALILEPSVEKASGPGTRPVLGPGVGPVLGSGMEPLPGPGTETVLGPGREPVLGPGREPVCGPGVEPVLEARGARHAPARSAVAG